MAARRRRWRWAARAERVIDERDLDAAVVAGVLDAETRERLVNFTRDLRRGTAGGDEESFRLLTGFNDIFVAIAIGLLLVAVGGIAGIVSELAATLAIAVTSWALAEYFTRQRRMALPSVLLLLSFSGAVFLLVVAVFGGLAQLRQGGNILQSSGILTAAGVGTAAAAAAHWWRFRVPITVAAGAGALSLTAISLVGGVIGPAFAVVGTNILALLVLLCGIGVFTLAMWYDGRDPARITRRSDVAFWLHLLAAPMLVHPLFYGTGLSANAGRPETAVFVVVAFVLLTLVALAIDRRALIVSALGYAIFAIQTLVGQGSTLSISSNVGLLLVGLMLVLLSAGWRRARALLVPLLPAGLRANLPTIAA
jgi:hypothetical protein